MEHKNLTRAVSAGAVLAALLLLGGCSIHEQRSATSGDKKVDISTPFGSIKVNTAATAEDTGWPVYPGAHIRKAEDEGHNKSANVNISGPGFGLKVAVVEYESDDTPEKVLGFYRDKMKSFGGAQLECKNTSWDIGTHRGDQGDDLKCDDRSHGEGQPARIKPPRRATRVDDRADEIEDRLRQRRVRGAILRGESPMSSRCADPCASRANTSAPTVLKPSAS